MGIPFEEFRTYLVKLRYMFISIPAGKGLLSPCNQVLGKEPKNIFLHRKKPLLSAIRDCHHLLELSKKSPMSCKELATGWPNYIGVKYVYIHGIGGIITGEGKSCIPNLFHLAWPDDLKELFRKSNITNSDLEMAGLSMLWLVIDEICPQLRAAYVALFINNLPTVGWVKRHAVRVLLLAMQLVRALALRLKKAGASSLTPLHIVGE